MSDKKEGFQSPVAARRAVTVTVSKSSPGYSTPIGALNRKNSRQNGSLSASSSEAAGLFSPAPQGRHNCNKRRKVLPSGLFSNVSSPAPPLSAKTDNETMKTPDNLSALELRRSNKGAEGITAKKKLVSLMNPMSPSHITKEPNEVCIEVIDLSGCREGLSNLPREWSVQQLVDSFVQKRSYGEGDYYLYDRVSNTRVLGSNAVGQLDNTVTYKVCL